MIPLYGRIVCVADSYDAMASDRVYRKHLPEDKILEELRRNSGTQFDPEIVAVMIALIQTGRIKELDMEISAITIDE
jgi:HD-GYP domain-containing protein (c-di-GMP phosphodiesterase class II)